MSVAIYVSYKCHDTVFAMCFHYVGQLSVSVTIASLTVNTHLLTAPHRRTRLKLTDQLGALVQA